MTGSQIRQRFLEHFKGRDHTVLPSAPLVLQGDPTTLFTIAGMQPLKPYFQGLTEPPAAKLTSCQKVFRTADLDEIGKTDRHCTFYEMLGNFAPTGGYFKEMAIPLAWELVTEGFGIPRERIRVTVHPDDELARATWGLTSLGPDRVHAEPAAWWAAGATGPCGPCSELFYDRGREFGCGQPDCYPEHCERYLEFWNLVFMQFDAQDSGDLAPLPRPGVDTGMGLERITAILQGVSSVFECDLIAPILAFVREQSEKSITASERKVADHLRAMTFLIGDGVRPSNEGRGYVLRRVIRRAAVHAQRLGMRRSLADGVEVVAQTLGDHYPEIPARADVIRTAIQAEVQRFTRTLDQGLEQFSAVVARNPRSIPGPDAFKLHDTFGFPLELTRELAAERGVEIDEDGFASEMAAQRERSRSMTKRRWVESATFPTSEFVGYQTLGCESPLLLIRHGGETVEQATEGEEVEIFLATTPFYPESGGQVGDTGVIQLPGGRIRVEDTQRPAAGVIAHLGTVELGVARLGEIALASVDAARRRQVARHHSATHLLHKALRESFGEGTVQRGSWVGPDHTTFDFVHERALTPEELEQVGHRVNGQIRAALPLQESLLSYQEAVSSGAMHLFEEKYGDVVRMICFGDWSCELCGGTHIANTADIGPAFLISDSSVGAGVRRVEMVVGEAAEALAVRRLREVAEVTRGLGGTADQLQQRVAELKLQVKERERQIEQLRDELVTARVRQGTPESFGTRVPVRLEALDGSQVDLKAYVDRMLESLSRPGVVAATSHDRYVIKVSEELTTEFDANQLKSEFGPGGGSARLVQGRLDRSPEAAFGSLRERLR
ncbi:MAG TPA: alanine--tRNA ligase [Candidatus Dormibacteraeota bacterium]|nr:alanine--tRNA ligase [Candidatus Dormibacteraeota bacterium]